MKPSSLKQVIAFAGVLLCGVACAASQVNSTATAQNSHPHAPAKRVMAPPPDTRAAVKLRPSSSEAGLSRTAKPPLKVLPAITGITTARAGGNAASSQRTGHWLLLYRTESCVPCDRLTNVLAASDSTDLRNGVPYTIIVGGSSSASLGLLRAKYNTLADASWVADPDRTASKSLQTRGAPELFAMDGNRIAWKISGNFGNPQQVLHIADSWIAGTAAADAAAREKANAVGKASAVVVSAAPVKR